VGSQEVTSAVVSYGALVDIRGGVGRVQVASGDHTLPKESLEQLLLECQFREEWRVGT
jgi:hypothetical protein